MKYAEMQHHHSHQGIGMSKHQQLHQQQQHQQQLQNSSSFDPSYNDELENSIIDSLSEISIASNLPLNMHSQDLLNRTVTEVISAYLWSNILPGTQTASSSSTALASPSNNNNSLVADSLNLKNHQQQQQQQIKQNSKQFEPPPPAQMDTSGSNGHNKDRDRGDHYRNNHRVGGEGDYQHHHYSSSHHNPNHHHHHRDRDKDRGGGEDQQSVKSSKTIKNKLLALGAGNGGSGMIAQPDEISDDSIKLSPNKKISKQQQQQNAGAGGDKNGNSKLVIPVLDLSYLTNQEIKGNAENNEKTKTTSTNGSGSSKFKSSAPASAAVSKSGPGSGGGVGSSETIVSREVKSDIESLLHELFLAKNLNADMNEYYDQDFEARIGQREQEKLNAMAFNLKDLLSRLLEKRRVAKRNKSVDQMSREENQSEKIDTQKELLTFEEKQGRPQTKLEKDLMRPLYDHYRKVKRILTKNNSSNSASNGNSGAQASSITSNTVTSSKITSSSASNNQQQRAANDNDHSENGNGNGNGNGDGGSGGSNYRETKNFLNLHSMSIAELYKEKEVSLLEKVKLKDTIKKYELDFAKANGGRQLSKEDREYNKDEIEKYKILKAKLKLIEALLEKYESLKKNKKQIHNIIYLTFTYTYTYFAH